MLTNLTNLSPEAMLALGAAGGFALCMLIMHGKLPFGKAPAKKPLIQQPIAAQTVDEDAAFVTLSQQIFQDHLASTARDAATAAIKASLNISATPAATTPAPAVAVPKPA